ncbi:MAG: hypothetical protein HDS65_08540 [Bacteroidales bacterium]|nr:hypothetical protein [Bacteroidales bacterium]
MKKLKLFSAALAMLLLGSCANEETLNIPESTSPGIHVHLSGAAGGTDSRATVTADKSEKTVNSVLAVLFDTHEGFFKTVEASKVADDEYTFIVEKDATYRIYLVANADADLRKALEDIDPGTDADDAENGLEAVIAAQAPDAKDNFLMLSKYPETVTTRITETQSIGTVHMERLAARFDIVNKAEGITVDKITFNNRTLKTSVLSRNVMTDQTDWFENTPYPDINLDGEKNTGNTYDCKIYTYENFSLSGDTTLPSLTIEYTEDGKTKSHEVLLIDPDSEAGTAMSIKRNHRYRIVLTKAYKLKFEVEVADWDAEETFAITGLPLELPEDRQEELNSQLLVHNLFTEYNVRKIDTNTKKVTEFFTELPSEPGQAPSTAYTTMSELINKKLLSDDAIFTDDAGNNYRFPTAGEWQLLIPLTNQAAGMPVQTTPSGLSIRNYPFWGYDSSQTMETDEFIEKVYLKNNQDNFMALVPEDLSEDTENGFKGTSILKVGRVTDIVYANKELTFSETKGSGYKDYQMCPVYGLRFKGSDQFAAYKWELVATNGNRACRYLSVKIKALPKDADIIIDDIVDNHSFWAKGYIEVKLPAEGRYDWGVKKVMWPCQAYYLSTTKSNDTAALAAYFDAVQAHVRHIEFQSSYSIRLVNIKD